MATEGQTLGFRLYRSDARSVSLVARASVRLDGLRREALSRSVVRDDSIVADVGANQGLYTLWLARVATSGTVYAFEPDPELFECLEHNVRTNRLQRLAIRAAVSDRSGTLALTANRLNRGDNRVNREKVPRTQDMNRVPAVTLDESIPEQPFGST